MDRFLPDLVRDEDYPVAFGRYTLTGLLGEGGMARVFRAELAGPQGFTKPVAVKIIRAAIASQNADLKRALVHEARIGGMLHHPNLVEVYELGELRDFPFIAMELVEGVGLDLLVERVRPLPVGTVLEIGRQICAGLHHAHQFEAAGIDADLVHRDLKPSNVLLSRNGVVKIADFGIAKAGDMTGNTTATGIAKGTPAYMSPQQANAERIDRRSDIFALGAMLYELATGQRLFRGETLVSTLMAVLRVEERLARPGFDDVLEGVLPGLAGVVRTCLRHDPAQRYPSCEHLDAALAGLQRHAPGCPPLGRWLASIAPELEKSLDGEDSPRVRAAVAHLTAPTGPEDRVPPTSFSGAQQETRITGEPAVPPPARRRSPPWIAGAGLLVLLVGLGALGLRGRGSTDDPGAADLSVGAGAAGGAGGAEAGGEEPVEPGGALVDEAIDPSAGSERAADGSADAAPSRAGGAAEGASQDRSTSGPPAAPREPDPPPPTPQPRPTPPPTPEPRPTPPPPKPTPDDRPEEVPAWEPPEATPTPRPAASTSTVPPPSREALERAGSDRAPNRDLLREATFRLSEPKTKHKKRGRTWELTISARVAGSNRVDAVVHLRAGSGTWQSYPMERSRADRWEVEIELPNTVDRDLQYWIEAENQEPDPGRVGRQVTTLGSALRPQFHFLD